MSDSVRAWWMFILLVVFFLILMLSLLAVQIIRRRSRAFLEQGQSSKPKAGQTPDPWAESAKRIKVEQGNLPDQDSTGG